MTLVLFLVATYLYCASVYSTALTLVPVAGVSCAAGDLSMNSKCYRKFHSYRTWYSASSDCLSHGGSLAVFADIERPSDNRQLTDWLTIPSTDKTYWIGLVRSWWSTTDEGNIWHY